LVTLGGCAIHVARGLVSNAGPLILKHAPAHRYALVTDENVGPLYAAAIRASLAGHTMEEIVLPPGETFKTRESWALITDRLLDAGFGRDSAIIALGGGVIGDLAGFVAATFLRGVAVVQIPTTLVAMVDAAIGGKTGVDTPGGKNLVGVFHMPAAVLIDPQVLVTLPLRELRAGFAEVLKSGVVADEAYFESSHRATAELLSGSLERSDKLEPLIVGGMEIKVRIVAQDERENGLRKVLNFGHTIGHAVEVVSEYSLLHGEAVSIGMALESELAERIGTAAAGTASRIREALDAAGLPTKLPRGFDAGRVMQVMQSDKKARGGKIRFALPRRVGEMAKDGSDWSVPVAGERIQEVLA
jgi:3-dehydroquinate synthase